jgi:hypothetical protein
MIDLMLSILVLGSCRGSLDYLDPTARMLPCSREPHKESLSFLRIHPSFVPKQPPVFKSGK